MFRVYYLHGLASSCEGTKARLTREIVSAAGGEFHCFNVRYLTRGNLPWEVVQGLKDAVKTDLPFFLIGSSMGAYTWLDFLTLNAGLWDEQNLKRAIFITPPVTLFDDLDKWNVSYADRGVILNYGEGYEVSYRAFVKLLHWDLKGAPFRTLNLAEEKAFSIVAARDSVVSIEPIKKLLRVKPNAAVKFLDDDHRLDNSLSELRKILQSLLVI